MRRAFLLSCLLSVLALFAVGAAYTSQTIELNNYSTSIELVSQDNSEIVLKVDIGSIKIDPVSTKAGSFAMLTVDGFSRFTKIGEPALPVLNKVISIPFGCALSSEIVETDVEEIFLDDHGITDKIIPAQPSLSKSQNPETVPFEYNQALYQKSGYYGLPPVESSTLGTLRSLHLGTISVAPFEYDPVNNSIKVAKHLIVKVKFDHPDWNMTSEMQTRYYSPMFEPVYSQIINYEPPAPVILNDLVTYPVKYLIVANRMFQTQLQPFIEWKTKKGFTVITAYTDIIGSTNTAIRNYIMNQYNSSNPPSDPAPSFVLLVGDVQQIPAFDLGAHVSDLDFCEFTGDDIPEIYYGRFSAQSTALLQPQIDKTLEYEKYLMPDPSYLGNVTMIAGVDASHAPTWGNGQINYGTTYYFNSSHGIYSNTWLYPASDGSGVPAAVIQTVNNGIGFINYTAHGSHDGWADPSFSSSDVSGLTNVHKYLLAIGNCCLTNTFGDDYSTPCMGEVWLQSSNKGAIGYIGGSNSTYWDEDYWWGVGAGSVVEHPTYEATGRGAYDGVFHDHGEPLSGQYIVNDALVFAGNMAVVEGGGASQYYWQIYHLMGDPSVMTYLGIPAVNNVSHASSILITATSFTVTAAPGSYVGLSMNGVLHGAAYIGQSGSVSVPVTAFGSPGTADIVVTAQNRRPYIQTIQVISPSGPYVIFDSFSINDLAGNNNGEADAGESITLGVQLKNVGPDNANNTTAVLSAADSYINITDANESYGTIPGNNGTVNRPSAFAFNAASNTPDGHNVNFTLTVSGTALDTWISNFSIPVHAPVLELSAVSIDDASGNDNGIMDPGESIEVTVTLANSGSASAENVVAALSENDDYVTIIDNDGSFGNITPGQSGDNSGNTFMFEVADDLPIGHSVQFDLALSADGGYTASMQFTVSAIESFEFSDGGWTGSGVWEWGEPTSGPGGAYDGLKVWATVLGGQYPDNADDNLLTIEYHLNGSNFNFSYYQWYDFENSYDGGNLHISTDGGATWDLLYPDGGYNDDAVVGLDNEPGFTSSSGGWLQAVVNLDAYSGQDVIIRFRFGSDGSVTGDGWYIDAVVLEGDEGLFPAAVISPSSLHASLEPDETTTLPIYIANEGEANLQYSAMVVTDDRLTSGSADSHRQPSVPESDVVVEKVNGLVFYNYVGPKSIETDASGDSLVTDSGGPDAFGYSWVDSDDPGGPTYRWVDITSIGIQITGLDDDTNVGPYPIGFNFEFYGNSFSTFRFSTNGFISFTSTVAAYDNQPLPYTDEPFNLVAPFWDDLDFRSSGQAYYYSSGDSLIVSCVAAPHFSSGGPYTFQVILLANGKIIYQYQDINSPDNSATIGIENGSGTISLQMAYNQAYVHENLAIQISAGAQWLDIAQTSGTVGPHASDTVDVLFDASDLADGDYNGLIAVTSNDPLNPAINIPVTLTVGLDAALIGLNLSSITDTVITGQSKNVGMIITNDGNLNLDYTITDNRSWIAEAPTGGSIAPSGSNNIAITLDALNLPLGSYSGSITVNSNAYNNPSVVMPVNLLVIPPPTVPDIDINLTAIVDTVGEGGLSSVNLEIENLGTGDLHFAMTDNRTWISESPANDTVAASGMQVVVVSMDASALSIGTYTGTLTVSSDDPDESSIPIGVTLVVQEAGTGCEYMPGDINGDGNTIGSDITFAVNFFRGSPNHPPDSCYDDFNSSWLYVAGDVNGDCRFVGSDITYYVGFFRSINTQILYCPRLAPNAPGLEPSEPPVLGVPIRQPDSGRISKVPAEKIDTEKGRTVSPK